MIGAPVRLNDGDEIQIALRFKLAFVDAGATAPLTLDNDRRGLRIDKETRQVWANGILIDPPLSLHQYRLLEGLWDSGGSVVTREQIIEAVWPEAASDGVSEQAIDALVGACANASKSATPNSAISSPCAATASAWKIDEPPAGVGAVRSYPCLLYTSPSPRDRTRSRMPSSA